MVTFAAVVAAVLVVGVVVPLVRAVLFWTGDATTALAGWLDEQALIRVVLESVRHYIEGHCRPSGSRGHAVVNVVRCWRCVVAVVLLPLGAHGGLGAVRGGDGGRGRRVE
ncbi:hypothetical protein [Micromonospora sp. HM5-17]|uniref:hypothetical protein n=1 Tax=Micromonospora sp. HM5-17 TaxID=2487710 RepID=UPI000F472CCB|nr:hypothetical protein [Micromonospora sp. HM5-17]ROT33499.1 hypothetical protein EF879_00540 [Micromonospora sp. HM5-17]